MLARTWRKRISFALLVGMQAGAATLENSIEVPQKIKNRATLWPSNCTTRHLSMGYRCAVSQGHTHPNVYSSTINSSQSMERAQMSIDGWMGKEDVVYIYSGVLLGNQKNEILSFATTWMELEGIMLSDISQSEKDRYHMFSLLCGSWATEQKTMREGKAGGKVTEREGGKP